MTRPHSPATAMTNSRSRFVVTYSVRPSGETTAPSGSPSIDIAPTRNCRTRSTTATSLVNWFVTQARSPDGASTTRDRKSTRLNSSHGYISYAVFCLKKKKKTHSSREALKTLQRTTIALTSSKYRSDTTYESPHPLHLATRRRPLLHTRSVTYSAHST